MQIYKGELAALSNSQNLTAVNELMSYMTKVWLEPTSQYPPRQWSVCLAEDVRAGFMDLSNSNMEAIVSFRNIPESSTYMGDRLEIPRSLSILLFRLIIALFVHSFRTRTQLLLFSTRYLLV